jgi:branched-chain amino acid transport system substrate-binding protein
MKRVLSSVLILLIVLGVLVTLGCSQEKEIKIGFVGPMTGDYANYGELMSQAVAIAVEEWNADGGIGGVPVALVIEDSEGKADKANAAIEKLASVDRIFGLVGAVFSGSSLAIAPRANQEKIVMISPSSTHADLTALGEYIFRDVVSDALQAQVFAHYVYKELGLRNVAILYTKNDYSQGLAEGFKSTFESLGGKIIAMESGQQGDKDFKTQLTTIKNLDPDGLFLPNYVAEIAQMLEQAAQLGIEAQLLSADGFSNPEIFDLAGDYVDGVIYSGPEIESAGGASAGRGTEAFTAKYTEKYNVGPDSFSLNAYDGANIIFAGIQKAYAAASDADKASLNLDREIIRQAVADTAGYQGVSGEITFDAIGDVVKNQGILTVQNGAYTQLGVYRVVDEELQVVE